MPPSPPLPPIEQQEKPGYQSFLAGKLDLQSFECVILCPPAWLSEMLHVNWTGEGETQMKQATGLHLSLETYI